MRTETIIEQTVQAYNRVAEKFSATWFHDTSLESRLTSFISRLESNPCVLDMGSGCGRDLSALLRAGVETVGIDLSPAMLAQARRNVPNGIFRHMDARHVLYPADSFSGVWMCAVLLHMPEDTAQQVLQECWRVLKPSGILAVTVEEGIGESIDTFSRYKRLFSRNECETLLTGAGFSVLSAQTAVSSLSTDGSQRKKQWLELVARKNTLAAHQNTLDCCDNCLLCPGVRFDISRKKGAPGISSVLWSDNDLFVFIDIAPIVEGHLLLTTDAHYPCYGAMPAHMENDLLDNMRFIDGFYRKAYGSSPVFCEHGPASPKKAGACIAHAHLHCLPSDIPIEQILTTKLGRGQSADLASLRELYKDKMSYIFIGDATGKGRAFIVDVLPSQYLRQVVSAAQGRNDWQWQAMREEPSTQGCVRKMLSHLMPIADEMLRASSSFIKEGAI